jgi:hypothetical protein
MEEFLKQNLYLALGLGGMNPRVRAMEEFVRLDENIGAPSLATSPSAAHEENLRRFPLHMYSGVAWLFVHCSCLSSNL